MTTGCVAAPKQILLRRSGDPVVDDILKRLQSSGSLAAMLRATAHDYEEIKGFDQDSLADAILPSATECFVKQ